MIVRVLISPDAKQIIKQLKAQFGALMFHQSGGCCDGSQPMCFAKGDFIIGSSDVCLGEIEDCEFWMSKDQFEVWKHTQLTVDITQGRGSSFSIEIPLGLRFILHSKIFTPEQENKLSPVFFKVD
ncbi:MAG: DUF779 domain-containing protein [Bacteroidetes bacterium]|nr:DUF779 domain-containing protein [Bacteroidota bacterium]